MGRFTLGHRYRFKYSVTPTPGNMALAHTLIAIGRHGALHFHCHQYAPDRDMKLFPHEFAAAGLEVHWRHPPDYMSERPPSHDRCWVIDAPCWHDGTSLYAEETILPHWLAIRHDPVEAFLMLANEADERFGEGRE